MTSNVDAYHRWLSELLQLARAQEAEWLVAPTSETHRAAFDRGLSPEEELQALKDLSEWRGCGCGGSA